VTRVTNVDDDDHFAAIGLGASLSIMEAHYYNAHVTWNKDRRGTMWSPEFIQDGSIENSIEVATPPEFPKGVAGIWSPEHLFTAAISSCFMTTFLAIADNSKLEFKSFTCHAKGKLEKVDGKLQMTEVHLEPVLVINKEEDRERAMRVLTKTEPACLITNSVKAHVSVTPTVRVDELSVKLAQTH
jgi:organic hydroperoxide reductase OsmC/OhrA